MPEPIRPAFNDLDNLSEGVGADARRLMIIEVKCVEIVLITSREGDGGGIDGRDVGQCWRIIRKDVDPIDGIALMWPRLLTVTILDVGDPHRDCQGVVVEAAIHLVSDIVFVKVVIADVSEVVGNERALVV